MNRWMHARWTASLAAICMLLPAAVCLSQEPKTSAFLLAGLKLFPAVWDKAANFARLEEYARKAAAAGASVVVTPEGYLEGYVSRDDQEREFSMQRLLEVAEPENGPYIAKARELARALRIHLLLGFAERRDRKVYNTVVLITPQGGVAGKYSKTHLAGNEKERYAAGSEFPVYDTPFARIGLLICYDRQLPETSRILALRGAQIILVPAFGVGTTEINEDVLMRTRAYENGVYVAHVHPKNTFIVDPEGNIEAQARGEGDEIVLARIKLDGRIGGGAIRSRRPELYGDLIKDKKP